MVALDRAADRARRVLVASSADVLVVYDAGHGVPGAMTARTCGDCTMCCKLLAVPALSKPQGKWCSHCIIGSRCSIYDDRPDSCRAFKCLWLQGYGTEDMRPDRTKVVMASTTDAKSLVLHVDATRPAAHRTPAYESVINAMIKDGGRVFVVCGDKRTMIEERKQ